MLIEGVRFGVRGTSHVRCSPTSSPAYSPCETTNDELSTLEIQWNEVGALGRHIVTSTFSALGVARRRHVVDGDGGKTKRGDTANGSQRFK